VPRQNNDLPWNQEDEGFIRLGLSECKTGPMVCLLRLLPVLASRLFRTRRDILLENLALRQQLAVLKRKHPKPWLVASERLFWVLLRRFWCGWKQALIIVQPETVVRWRRAGFKAYWTWVSLHRNRPGRKCMNRELRELIFRMVGENRTWGAPRKHAFVRQSTAGAGPRAAY
jgi:hypothetical protein